MSGVSAPIHPIWSAGRSWSILLVVTTRRVDAQHHLVHLKPVLGGFDGFPKGDRVGCVAVEDPQRGGSRTRS
jgi:hypothetical protein